MSIVSHVFEMAARGLAPSSLLEQLADLTTLKVEFQTHTHDFLRKASSCFPAVA